MSSSMFAGPVADDEVMDGSQPRAGGPSRRRTFAPAERGGNKNLLQLMKGCKQQSTHKTHVRLTGHRLRPGEGLARSHRGRQRTPCPRPRADPGPQRIRSRHRPRTEAQPARPDRALPHVPLGVLLRLVPVEQRATGQDPQPTEPWNDSSYDAA